MANPYHHALSSAKKWGGTWEDYIVLHDWFDETKKIVPDVRHRALRHHAEGIFLLEQIFGHAWLVKSTGRTIPTRWVGEQHVKEDFSGRIPTAQDWLSEMPIKPWMGKGALPLSKELEEETSHGPG